MSHSSPSLMRGLAVCLSLDLRSHALWEQQQHFQDLCGRRQGRGRCPDSVQMGSRQACRQGRGRARCAGQTDAASLTLWLQRCAPAWGPTAVLRRPEERLVVPGTRSPTGDPRPLLPLPPQPRRPICVGRARPGAPAHGRALGSRAPTGGDVAAVGLLPGDEGEQRPRDETGDAFRDTRGMQQVLSRCFFVTATSRSPPCSCSLSPGGVPGASTAPGAPEQHRRGFTPGDSSWPWGLSPRVRGDASEGRGAPRDPGWRDHTGRLEARGEMAARGRAASGEGLRCR